MCDHHHDHDHAHAGVAGWERRAVLRLIGAGGAALTASACATSTNPDTGRGQFIIISDDQMSTMALQAWEEQLKQTPRWNNPAQTARLQRVGMRIASSAGRANQSWEFALFDSEQKNAFVLPGNKVGFYRGLTEICDQDDDMAVVLGHEVGHVTGRHAAERVSRDYATQTVLQAAGTQIDNRLLMAALGLGAQVGVSLPFSRSQESEADILGLGYAHGAGFDVKRAIPFWQRMASGGGSRPPEFLSTHPGPENRIEAIRAHINAQGWGPV